MLVWPLLAIPAHRGFPKVGSMSDELAVFFPTACVTRHRLPPMDSLKVEAIVHSEVAQVVGESL